MEQIFSTMEQMDGLLAFSQTYEMILRYAFPLLAVLILLRCAKSLLTFEKEPEIWAWLIDQNGDRLPIQHWETLLGRSKTCDTILSYPTISRTHAVLTRYDDGSWSVSDVGSKGGIQVNGADAKMAVVYEGDVISLGGVPFVFEPITGHQEYMQASARTRAGKAVRPALTMFFLTVFQLLVMLQLLVWAEEPAQIAVAFLALMAIEWVLFIFTRMLHRSGFEMEIIAFFLTTLGMAVIASDSPGELKKQLLCIVAGLTVFLILCWALRDLERAKRLRYIAAAGSLLLLAVNLVFGVELGGAKNWIYIGGISFQPSELAKVGFIMVGASTLQRIMTKRNMFLFIAYSAMICGCLALMNDFGTALIFFTAFLIIAYMRSGSFATIALILTGVGMAGVMAIRFRPHMLSRFSAWGHVWENPLTTGYQQTRAMMCIASGGLFGLGAGKGWLKYVAASDTDLVFAFVAEEWGLIMALLMVLSILIFGAFVVRSASVGRSSFYTIGACAAGGILMVQTVLNVFGTVDLLPLTGVTLPFVSNGGSSMIACWGLLAFLKAADTRQNASMAVKLPSKRM